MNEVSTKEEIRQSLSTPDQSSTLLAKQAEKSVQSVLNLDMNSLQARKRIQDTIDGFGDEIVSKSIRKNQLLEKTLGQLSRASSESGAVVHSLNQLNLTLKELDPSGISFEQNFFSRLFSPIKNYFEKYEEADEDLKEIFLSLQKGKKALRQDNTTIEIEQQSLRELSAKLADKIELGRQLAKRLENALNSLRQQGADRVKIDFIEQDILYPLNRKLVDLQQMQLVNEQGYYAMDIVRKNNRELISAITRAQTVTMAALRTAVILAGAKYNQRLGMKNVREINLAADNLAKSSASLRPDSQDFQSQLDQTSASVETLKQAFENAFNALDGLQEYRNKALPQMEKSLEDFHQLARQGKERISHSSSDYLDF